MNSHVITPGPYRATKLWNEVTRLFRSGMPLKKHRQTFRHHASCFTASAAVDWLHQLLRSNSNFGPDVTRQQTVQLLKKFLKNHVIEDVKGRWGTEDLEDSSSLYRFPSTSPLKPIPRPAPASSSIRKRPSLRDKDGFFRFRSLKKQEKETQENVDPALQTGEENHPDQQLHRRELTVEDEQDIWRDITLTHLQRILGLASLEEVLNQRSINPHNIIHNMTKVNKHGVVTLDDKTDDLPHWVLSAMKSLANWPKYDSAQPSYPGFERDVFKTVSDYFYSLPQPLLTYELYELFINVLVLCGYVAAPPTYQRGKRKKSDLPSVPPPAKASFRSTECLLLSLLRQGTCDEGESPMTDVLGGKLQSRMAALKGSGAGDPQFGGSCTSLSTFVSTRPQTRSGSLETILSDSAPLARQQLFLSNESLASCSLSRSHSDSSAIASPPSDSTPVTKAAPVTREPAAGVRARNRLSVAQRVNPLRPHSVGSCLDIVIETREEEDKETKWQSRAASCLNVNAPTDLQHFSAASRPSYPPFIPPHPPFIPPHPPFIPPHPPYILPPVLSILSPPSLQLLWPEHKRLMLLQDREGPDPVGPDPPPAPLISGCLLPPLLSSHPPQTKPEHSLLQSHCERVAIEALQLCTLLLPPTSRRKLQLLMRMTSRISQNVDMPRLHPAIGTRTLMVHTFSGCVLGSAEECDLDELLATRLVSFLMDHQQSILSVPDYLLGAISDHVQYLRTAQVPIDTGFNVDSSDVVSIPVPVFAFCRQISGAEFEQQKQASSRKAMEDLLEILLTDQNISEKDRRKKLKQFQKQYPDIYSHRCPAPGRENKTDNKPKIKPALLNIKKTKPFSIRN
ncbi:unnamed protein product [Pleuronectes platessa]|uniref:DEP domain-containing protein n=1 Tax=Pleuronectes platessa TaxID=8262 RepID=A0A9N7V6L2_PLEPL|nr:unnamed protein product [Pleuronectes platessa]